MPENKHEKRIRHAYICVARSRICLFSESFQVSHKAQYANSVTTPIRTPVRRNASHRLHDRRSRKNNTILAKNHSRRKGKTCRIRILYAIRLFDCKMHIPAATRAIAMHCAGERGHEAKISPRSSPRINSSAKLPAPARMKYHAARLRKRTAKTRTAKTVASHAASISCTGASGIEAYVAKGMEPCGYETPMQDATGRPKQHPPRKHPMRPSDCASATGGMIRFIAKRRSQRVTAHEMHIVPIKPSSQPKKLIPYPCAALTFRMKKLSSAAETHTPESTPIGTAGMMRFCNSGETSIRWSCSRVAANAKSNPAPAQSA